MFAMLVGTGLVVVGAAVAFHHRHGGHSVMLACALKRLGATAAQKQLLGAVFHDVRGRMQNVRQRAAGLHGELADILAAPAVDGQQLEALEAKLFETLGDGAQVLREAVSRVHATLEPKQREQLAEWLRRGGHRHHRHCCAVCC